EQAEISRKEQHANPLVVVINCNSAFPGKLNEFTLHPDAVMRRRDMVVRITIKPEFKGKTLDDPSLKLTENCEHLMVQLYENPRSESKLLDPIPYVDFLKYAGNAFKIFHARESKKVQVRLERYMEMSGTQGLKIQDPFSLYYQQPQHQQNLLPSLGTPFNQLKDSIEELKFCIEQHQKS
ncbi:hypothetical protein, partial [Bacillus anthracis]|uniref:hypothetical protein n=1 Tax=Bacillus anthracis TaxID=1392 RepID=UPI001E36C863